MTRAESARKSAEAAGPGRRGAGTTKAVLACLLALAGCDDFAFPRDPDNTLEEVLATGTMTVAAVDHAPWVAAGDGALAGIEVALVEAFARDLGAEIEWRPMPALDAVEAVSRDAVDLAIGGFVASRTPAGAGAAPTYAFFTEGLIVGARPGTPVPESIEGKRIATGEPFGVEGLIRERGGIPVADPEEADLVALPGWALEGSGLVPTGVVLHRDRHVMVVPQGENAWLMRLERFLRRSEAEVPAMLRETLQ